jgi:GTP-binding protein Era
MKSGMVVLLGRPNVGKSTFLNAVLKDEISIVSPKAQTTRDQIRGIVTEERGQIVFIDTPGVHRAREGGINAFMIQEVKRALDGPDLVLYIVDPYSKAEAEAILLDHLKASDAKAMMIVNKMDVLKRDTERFLWLKDWEAMCAEVLAKTKCTFLGMREISAERGTNVKELMTEIFELMPEGPPLYDDPDALTDRSSRFVVSEMIRKQLFLNLGDELPYSCAVEIESFEETAKPIKIHAIIFVDRESQKGMVIGAGGKKIKDIGTGARIDIEKLLGEKVYLELRVKVLDGWSEDPRKMKQLGYDLEQRKRKS